MSSRVSLPLFSQPAGATENFVLFGSAELCRRLGLTARQLQWWDEQGLLPARHERHKRLYAWRDAVLAGVIGKLRKAGLGQARLQTALQPLTAPARAPELPRYLVVNWLSGRSYAVQNDRQALERVATLCERGMPSLLIDLKPIESKLSAPDFSF